MRFFHSFASRFAGAILAAGFLLFGLMQPNEARAAFAVGTAVCTAQSKTAGTTLACTVTTQNISIGEIAVLWFAGDNTATTDGNDGLLSSVSDSAGNTWTVQRCFTNGQGTAETGATTCIATSKITAALTTASSATITATFGTTTAKAIVVKNFTVAAGNTIEIAGTPQDLANDNADPGSMTISGLTASTEYLFVRSTALERANATWTVTASHTIATCDGTTGGGAASNMNICGEFRILTATTDTSDPTATAVDNASTFIAFKEAAGTTLGNGTDPSNASLAPGGAATEADAFTFQTTSGTDAITAVVVGLATGASGGLSLVEITNDAGTTVYGSVTDPSSDTPTVTLSTNTLTATTTSTQYKIRVTPKSHAAMPVPPGSTYTVTAKINSWTGTNNAKSGTDTAGTTVTIDNLSSSDVTGATGTSGDGFVNLSWTNPGDAASVLVLRDTSTVATPAEGTSYTVPGTIGSSTIVCSGLVTTCNDTGVTNGTTYLYKIYTRDSIGNYSVGVTPTGSPYTPSGPGCYSVATGNWSATSTWASSAGGTPGTCPGSGNLPDSSTPVYINFTTTSHTVTVNVSNATATSVRIGTPGTGTAGLAMSSGTLGVSASVTIVGGTGTKKALLSFTTGTLKVGGSITESGATDVTFGTGTVEYNGTGNQTVAAYSYNNLTINKASGTATTGANITVGNNLTISQGTLNLANRNADGGGTGTLSLGSGAVLQIAQGNYFPSGYATESFNANSTVEYNATFNQTVAIKAYGHLKLSGTNTKFLSPGGGTTTLTGNLTTDGTAGAVVAEASGNLIVQGNLSFGANTSFTPNAYTVTMSGTSAQSIGGGVSSISFNNLTINNSAGVTANVNLSISGNFTNTAGFSAGTSTVTFNSATTTVQNITGVTTTFYNLILSQTNASPPGLTLGIDVTVSNVLTLTSGKITTGTTTAPNPYPYTLTTSASCATPSVSRPGGSPGHVVGNLRKNIPTGSNVACTFEVGDSTNYTPVDVTFASVSGAGSVTGATMPWSPDGHPAISGTDIDPTLNVNRFWTLKSNTATFTSYKAQFNFVAGDIDAGASTADFVIRRYSPERHAEPPTNTGTWSNVTLDT
ncbi:MAG: hypothetical protein HY083_04085, partial [Gammaproteobacteria bacterium]|nr:hypothetical protein [Gammaproteobacteria bacterium]